MCALLLEIQVNDNATSKIKSFADTTTQSLKEIAGASKESAALQDEGNKTTTAGLAKLKDAYNLLKPVAINSYIQIAKEGIALAKNMYGIIDATVTYRDEIYKLSKATGVSTEALAGFKYAADLAGSSGEDFDRGLKALIREMQGVKDGNAESVKTFKELGVSILDSTGKMKPIETVIYDVADALKGMGNDAERAAVSQKIFGRAGLDLLPMLMEGAEALKEYQERAKMTGQTFDQLSGEQAAKFKDAMTETKKAMQGLRMAIIGQSGIIPALTEMAITVTAVNVYFQQHGEILKKAFLNYTEIGQAIQSANIVWKLYIAYLEKHAKNTDEGAGKTKTFAQIMTDLRKEFNLTTGAVKAYNDARDDGDGNEEKGLGKEAEILKMTREMLQQKAGIEQMFRDQKVAADEEMGSLLMEGTTELNEWFIEQDAEKYEIMGESLDAYTQKQRDAQEAWREGFSAVLDIAGEFFGALASLQQSNLQITLQSIDQQRAALEEQYDAGMIGATAYNNQLRQLQKKEEQERKKAGQKYKTFAIAMTVADTLRAAQGAYASLASIPYVGVALAIAAAATALVSGYARVRQIQAQQFRAGGVVTNGPPLSGTGEVMIGALPGEGVINHRGMAAIGYEGLDRINKGQSFTNTFHLYFNTQSVDETFVKYKLIPMMNRMIKNDRVYMAY